MNFLPTGWFSHIVLGSMLGVCAAAQAQAPLPSTQLSASQRLAPVRVATIVAVPKPWQANVTGSAVVETYRRLDLTAALPGSVREILVTPGQRVTQGQPLIKFDTTAEEAELRVAQADLPQLKGQLDRQRDLASRGLTAQSKLDEAVVAYAAANARVARVQAIIERRTIVAPFAGTVGAAAVEIGQQIGEGTKLLRLQDAGQVKARLTLPQRQLALLAVGQAAVLRLASVEGLKLTGKIGAIETDVHGLVGAGEVTVLFDNPDDKIRAGMIVEVEIALAERSNVIAVPAMAISYTPLGDSIFLVREAKPGGDGRPALEAVRVAVQLGERRGDEVVIVKGLSAGDRLVVAGHIKLFSGAIIELADDDALPTRDQLRRN